LLQLILWRAYRHLIWLTFASFCVGRGVLTGVPTMQKEQEEDEKHQEGEEAPIHDFGDNDDSEDDTADPNQVLSFVGAAQAPPGYKILESCPSLETHEDMQNLIGKQILHAWDDKDRLGWFEGRAHGRNLNARDLARAPTANFAVRYINSLTVGVKKTKTIWCSAGSARV
jgi:hypothetical protein